MSFSVKHLQKIAAEDPVELGLVILYVNAAFIPSFLKFVYITC